MEDRYMCNLCKGYCKLDKGNRRDMDNSTEADTDTRRDCSCLLDMDSNIGWNNSNDMAPGMNTKVCNPYPNCM